MSEVGVCQILLQLSQLWHEVRVLAAILGHEALDVGHLLGDGIVPLRRRRLDLLLELGRGHCVFPLLLTLRLGALKPLDLHEALPHHPGLKVGAVGDLLLELADQRRHTPRALRLAPAQPVEEAEDAPRRGRRRRRRIVDVLVAAGDVADDRGAFAIGS